MSPLLAHSGHRRTASGPVFIWWPLERSTVCLVVDSDGRRRARAPSPSPPHAAPSVRVLWPRDGRASMKHQIISTGLRTDLAVTTIALGIVVICAVVSFTFTLVIAPF
jgi:hypothetical protein